MIVELSPCGEQFFLILRCQKKVFLKKSFGYLKKAITFAPQNSSIAQLVRASDC